jgi:DNA replication protein DnaC
MARCLFRNSTPPVRSRKPGCRAIERRFKCSRLQSQPSIDGFHFQHHKSRLQNKNRILRLLDLEFLHKGTNVVLSGNPGVGKTFLSKIIGWRICQANQRILFTTAMDMLNHLLASQVDHSLVRKLKTYTEPTALVVDELGYLALDQQTSNLFYQVISTRHSQKRSTIITTNTAFSDWGNILFNTTIATAIARPPRGELRDFLAGRRQPAQIQESESAGRVVVARLRASAALCDNPSRRSPPG